MDISGQTAIITGGASGLGEATGRRLASHGVKVGIFDVNEERGLKVAEEIGGYFAKVDVTSEESVDAGFEAIRKVLGQERILVNCAGSGRGGKVARRDRKTGEIISLSTDDFEWTIQLNLIGTFRCIAKSAAGMLTLDPQEDGDRGAIVNTSSIAAQDGQAGQAPYSASKAGIVGMALPIARDLARDGIRINTILPGIFATPLMLGASEKVIEGLKASVPYPSRLGNPDEYADLAHQMITNSYLNAEAVRLDGAIRMGYR